MPAFVVAISAGGAAAVVTIATVWIRARSKRRAREADAGGPDSDGAHRRRDL
jgi:hypothetical protein